MATPFACDMTAIEPEERGAHVATIGEIFGAVKEIRELPDGYSFRLDNETALLRKAAELVIRERLCCPFFGFALQIEPEGGAVWLSLTGREGVKPFIQAEIGEALPDLLALPIRHPPDALPGEGRRP